MSAPLPLLPTRPPDLAVRTHCPYCAFQCGIRMEDTHGADTPQIQGDPHFPVNNGQLCIKGWTSFGLLNHPRRLLTPLVRDSRHDDFREASWDDALDRIADAMKRTRERHGADANAVFGSGALTNEKAYLLGKFARVALGTANIDYNGRFCMSSAAAASNRAFGIDRGLPFPVSDLEHAELVVLVGANCADTLPPIMQWFERQKRRGGRLVVIDPRRTPTAKAADLHLPVTPGADLALANGLLYLALEAGMPDAAYIAARTTGFDAARGVALTYHPAHVERLTGISEAQMRQLVRWVGAARSCLFLTARGAEQHSKGVDTVHAWINLALALGLPGKPSSGWACLTGQGNGQGGREHGQKADQLPGYRLIEVDEHRAAVARVWGVDPASLPRKGKSAVEMIEAMGVSPSPLGERGRGEGGRLNDSESRAEREPVPPPPHPQPLSPRGEGSDRIRTLFLMGSNLAVASPDLPRTLDRLKALDFLAVCDAFPNESAALADVVLPVLQWAEEEGTMTNFEGRVIRRRQTARPPRGPRTDIDVLRELADRLGHAERFAFHSPRDVFDEFRRATAGGVADYSGISYGKIDEQDGVFWPCKGEGDPGTPRLFADRFFHPDGRARFFPVEHRPGGDPPDAAFPYLFTTGRYKEHYNSGAQTRQVDKLVSAKPRPRVQMHPTLARRHGVVSGQRVTLESRRGRAEFAAEVTPDIRPDTLFAPFHWGGKEAANALISGALDPTSRMPEFKLAAVRLLGEPAVSTAGFVNQPRVG